MYTNYLLKFLDAYEANGIRVTALTTGNEPSSGFSTAILLNKMGWTADALATWIAEYLGPSLANSIHNDTIILSPDDQTPIVQTFMEQVFSNQRARKFVAGIASHWYADPTMSNTALIELEEAFADKFFLMTEATTGKGTPRHLWGNARNLQSVIRRTVFFRERSVNYSHGCN